MPRSQNDETGIHQKTTCHQNEQAYNHRTGDANEEKPNNNQAESFDGTQMAVEPVVKTFFFFCHRVALLCYAIRHLRPRTKPGVTTFINTRLPAVVSRRRVILNLLRSSRSYAGQDQSSVASLKAKDGLFQDLYIKTTKANGVASRTR